MCTILFCVVAIFSFILKTIGIVFSSPHCAYPVLRLSIIILAVKIKIKLTFLFLNLHLYSIGPQLLLASVIV